MPRLVRCPVLSVIAPYLYLFFIFHQTLKSINLPMTIVSMFIFSRLDISGEQRLHGISRGPIWFLIGVQTSVFTDIGQWRGWDYVIWRRVGKGSDVLAWRGASDVSNWSRIGFWLCFLLAVWTWTKYCISLNLEVIIHKRGILIEYTLWVQFFKSKCYEK